MHFLHNCEYRYQKKLIVLRLITKVALFVLTVDLHILKISINSYINEGLIIASENAKIIISDNCLISYYVHLRTGMHNYSDRSILIKEQGDTEKDIIIGNDVWIGYGAQIMSGVTVADGCVIGAGAIVTKNTEPYGVYAGVPARRIKERV